MQTVIAKAKRGNYYEITPGNMPKEFDEVWGTQVRDRLHQALAGFGLVKGLNLDENGIVHLDLKRCKATERTELFDVLTTTLHGLGLHNPAEGIEYCELSPGTGES